MPLITLNNVDYGVGGPLLLADVVLSIEPGERIALIGRNGAGKSTLMRLIAGEIQADDGEIRREGGVRVARLEQEVPAGADGDVWDVVAGGLGELGADRKSTRLNSSHSQISYAVFCLKKKKKQKNNRLPDQ